MTDVSILGIGVATMDIYVDQKRMYPGGNEYNVACNAKMLGARAGFLGVFANDLAGEILEKTLHDLGVDTSFSHYEMGSSGYSLVRIKEDGDRIFLDWNRQGVTDLYPIAFTKEEMDYLKTYDVVSLGRCASVSLDKIEAIFKEGIPICYDFHAAFTQEDIETIAPFSRYGFFSCSHLTEEEVKETLAKAVSCGCSIAVGTSGCDPVLAYDGQNYYRCPIKKVEVLDALGAGDSYIGGFLTYYLQLKKEGKDQDYSVNEALKRAAEYSAKVVRIEGSVGVGYDVDPSQISNVINIEDKMNLVNI